MSATTPTHLMELFVQRAQIHTPELGQPRTEYLLTKAYRLIAELEGQNQGKLPSLGAAADMPPIPLLFGMPSSRGQVLQTVTGAMIVYDLDHIENAFFPDGLGYLCAFECSF